MAKSNYYRWLVGVAFLAFVTASVCTHPLAAQENGRGGGDRGGRRNGDRPRGDGPRGRDREEQADTKPAPAATTASASTSFGTSSSSETEKIRKWASDTMTKNDTDGNKILEGDELATLGQSGRDSDLDGDGKITTDELVQNSLKKARTSSTATKPAISSTPPSATTATGDTAASKPGERKLVNDTRKSYRFKSTKDRLPSWSLAGRDKNGDGQVSMSEYSRSWSDRTASEFQRYDTDGDGMITSEEKR